MAERSISRQSCSAACCFHAGFTKNHAACLGSFRGAGPRQGAARSAGVSVFWESLSATVPSAPGLTTCPELPLGCLFPLHAFSHELVKHPRSRLGSGTQLACDMRTDGAGVGLAGAELAKVTHGRGGGRNRVRRADLASFRLARRATRQQDENKPQPKRHAQKKKHDTQFPCGTSYRSRKVSRQP